MAELDPYQRLLALQEKNKPRKRPTHLESQLQHHCFRYFNNTYPALRGLYFSIPNGAHVTKRQANTLKAEGMTAGVADTFLAVPNRCHPGLFIEFKKETLVYDEKTQKLHKEKTYQREEQKKWQSLVEAQGFRYEVVRNFEEYINILDDYFNYEGTEEHKDGSGRKADRTEG